MKTACIGWKLTCVCSKTLLYTHKYDTERRSTRLHSISTHHSQV